LNNALGDARATQRARGCSSSLWVPWVIVTSDQYGSQRERFGYGWLWPAHMFRISQRQLPPPSRAISRILMNLSLAIVIWSGDGKHHNMQFPTPGFHF
jgi:hypothetical protein